MEETKQPLGYIELEPDVASPKGTLKDLLSDIDIESFNELVLLFYSLGEYAGWRKRALFSVKSGLTDTLGYDRFGLNVNGYNMANFPWDELDRYCWALDRHLLRDLIIPINWESTTELGVEIEDLEDGW